jgi:thiol-disulfide isomerase/thioredoxin
MIWLGLLLLCAACTPAVMPSTAVPPTATAYLAPDFSAATLDGGSLALSDLRGRWVVINFWASWCVPCAAEMPVLQRIADEYADTVSVVGVNMREDHAQVSASVAEWGIRYPILLNPTDEAVLAYSVVALPQTLVVAPDGELVWRSFGEISYESFTAELRRLMSSV